MKKLAFLTVIIIALIGIVTATGVMVINSDTDDKDEPTTTNAQTEVTNPTTNTTSNTTSNTTGNETLEIDNIQTEYNSVTISTSKENIPNATLVISNESIQIEESITSDNEEISFSLAEGEYGIEFTSGEIVTEDRFTVKPKPANIMIENIDVNKSVEHGEVIYLEYEIKNHGGENGHDEVSLSIGDKEEKRSIDLDPHESVTGSFTKSVEVIPYKERKTKDFTTEVILEGDSYTSEVEVIYDPGDDLSGDGLKEVWEEEEYIYLPQVEDSLVLEHIDLSGADPHQKDVFVEVVNQGDTLTTSEKEQIEAWWNDMPIENEDGTEGVNIHIQDELMNKNIDSVPSYDDQHSVLDLRDATWGSVHFQMQYHGTHHLVVMTEFEGKGTSRGITELDPSSEPFSVIDEDWEHRGFALTHEVLHNIVYELDHTDGCVNEYHTCSGFLSYGSPPENEFLSWYVAEQIEEDGIKP